MNLNLGLEKFGFSANDLDMENLFQDEKEVKKEVVPDKK